jgi:hypothetical protein
MLGGLAVAVSVPVFAQRVPEAPVLTSIDGKPVDPVTTPPPSSGTAFPLSWDDAVFASVATSGVVSMNGGTLTDKSITTSGQDAGQEASVKGPGTMTRVRIRSRECVRHWKDTLTVNWCWIEPDGRNYPGDHADGIQCYGSGGTAVIKNTTIRAYNSNAAGGYFSDDGWKGTHSFENVMFWGGPFGLHVTDIGGTSVSLKNVYFVKDSFGYGPYRVQIPVALWENVRWATISNGKLVPGDLIAAP